MKNVLIWGTGKLAAELCEHGINADIRGFIETVKSKEKFCCLPVYGVNEVWPEHDYVIVANTYTDEIYETCINEEINTSKFIFLYPIQRVGEKNLSVIKEILSEKDFTQYCIRYSLYYDSFFKEDLEEYKKKNTREQFKVKEEFFWPIIRDKYAKAGTIGNYFCQDLWAARLIYKSGVREHLDIGSRIDGFISHLLAMDIKVTIIDIREFPGEVENLHTIVDDATLLKNVDDESVESMSALCSIEHFGLGRYGDPVDPEACFKCFDNIQKKMKKGGRLYISLPIGKERVEFNAHRVFYPSTVIECFSRMDLIEFACTAEGKIEYNMDIHKYDCDTHNGEYRYGLFYFVKGE